MTSPRQRLRADSACAGFSILEGLVALALTGLVMTGVSMLVAQWVPAWNHGFHRVQLADLCAVALDRIVADLSEARYVTGSNRDRYIFFDGGSDAVTFVRPTLDPGERPGLEVVRISTIADKATARVVRRRAHFAPLPPGVPPAGALHFASSADLLRKGARILFSYADQEGHWRSQWDDPFVLPSRVRIELRDIVTGAPLVPPTTAVVHAQAPARCVSAKSLRKCLREEQETSGQPAPASDQQ